MRLVGLHIGSWWLGVLCGLAACAEPVSAIDDRVDVGQDAPRADDTGAAILSDTGANEGLADAARTLDAGGAVALRLQGSIPRALAEQLAWCGATAGGRVRLEGAPGRRLLDALREQTGSDGGLRLLGRDGAAVPDDGACGPAADFGRPPRPLATSSVDSTAPVGVSVLLNGGDATTRSSRATVSLAATDDTGVTQMCLSQSTSCTAWVPYATTGVTSFSGVAGPRTLFVRFRDAAGNLSEPISDTILYDATRPIDGTLTAVGSSGTVALSWSGFSDPGTGIASYVLRRAVGTTPPSSCTAGTEAWRGTGSSTTVTGLTDGTTYAWRLCALDGAGNLSAGATTLARPATEYDPPVDAAITINAGAAWTNLSTFTVSPSASDPSGVSHVCLSEAATCSRWVALAPTVRFAARRANGTRTVNAWFRDAMGNVTAAPVSDSIGLDLVRPVNGTLTASGSAGTVTLLSAGFHDALSGVSSYKLMQATGTRAPSTCRGTAVATSADGTFVRTGLVDGTTYSFRVCAVDHAGNVSSGVTASARPAPEYNPPTGGSVEINGGVESLKGPRVTLTLTATDDTQVSHVCLTNATTCTAWTPFATSKTWTFINGTGNRTVRAFFKDIYNNVTPVAVSDTVLQDQTRPVNGTAWASTGSGSEIDVLWSGFRDAHTGVASMRVVYAPGLRAPASCTTGRVGFVGDAAQATVTDLSPGQRYSFRVCAVDAVGNISTGVTATASTAANADAPEFDAFVINDGEAITPDGVLDLTLGAVDSDGVAEMCISDDPDACADWVTYDTAATFEVPSGQDGLITLHAWFRDGIDNVNDQPVDAAIVVDREAPLDTSLELGQSDDTTLTVTWTEAVDETTSVASYVAVYTIDGPAPGSCTEGEPLTLGADGFAALGGLPLGSLVHVRVCAVDLAGNISAGVLESRTTVDATPPTDGVIEINGGAVFAGSPVLTVVSSATDTAGVESVCISETSSCTDWVDYASTLTHTLAAGDGLRTLNLWFRDRYGNETASPVSDSIELDLTPPEDATLSELSVSGTTVDVAWSGAFDTGSGLATYRVVYAEGLVAPDDCEAGTLAYAGILDSFTLTGLTAGEHYALRLCAVDAVGNVSTGDTLVVRPLPELDAPVGSISINSSATWTNSATVTVLASATDASGVAQFCVSASAEGCTDWQAYPGPVSATLAGISAEQTLYGWFEDVWGTRSAVPVLDTIHVETTPPIDGDASGAATSDRTAQLEWADFIDADSGVAGYRAVVALTAAPADCTSGTLVYSGDETVLLADISGLLGGQVYGVRVCAIDAAGNLSPGVSFLISTGDTRAPTGASVSINAGAIGTRSRTVTLTLAATDDSGVSQMCISNTTTCTSWLTYATSRSWSLTTAVGTKTVYVKFRDRYGNTTTNATDTIIYEVTVPTTSTLSGTAVAGGVSNLSWTASTDASSGLAGYKLVVLEGTVYPASTCTTGTVLYNGPDRVFDHTGQVSGRKYSYRLCALDHAGNVTAGTTKQLTGLP